MRKITKTILLAATALVPSFAHAQGVLDTIQLSFQNASLGWFGRAQSYANHLFYVLLLLDFAWLTLSWMLKRHTFDELLPHLMQKIMVYGFFLALVVNAGTWLPAIENSFISAGGGIAGVSSLTPSTIIDTGNALAYGIITGNYSNLAAVQPTAATPPGTPAGDCTWYILCSNPVTSAVSASLSQVLQGILMGLLDILVGAVVWVCFVILAVELLITSIEAYLILGAGVFFLGFGASRWTTKFVDGLLNYTVSIGVKLMFLYLIVGVLMQYSVGAIEAALFATTSGGDAITSMLATAAGTVVMAMLAKSVPSHASSLLQGVTSLSGAHAAGAFGSTSGGAGAVASAGSAAMTGARAMLGKAAGFAGGVMTGGVGTAIAGAAAGALSPTAAMTGGAAGLGTLAAAAGGVSAPSAGGGSGGAAAGGGLGGAVGALASVAAPAVGAAMTAATGGLAAPAVGALASVASAAAPAASAAGGVPGAAGADQGATAAAQAGAVKAPTAGSKIASVLSHGSNVANALTSDGGNVGASHVSTGHGGL